MPTFDNASSIREILAQKNLAPRKSLGQNFLIDQNILKKIADAAELKITDLVLEIGPGLGALTEFLIRDSGKVIAVEYDKGLAGILKEKYKNESKLTVINEDILEFDLDKSFFLEKDGYNDLKVVANLPYYITTPIIFKLIESSLPWERLVFLVQKEVAQRIIAKPGSKEYGALSVMLNYIGKVEKVGIIPRTVFYPAPEVDSAVIRIIPYHSQELREGYPYLHQVVQAAFGQRRKTLLNAFGTLRYFDGKEEIVEFLTNNRIDPARRGETLTVEEFQRLAAEIVNQITKRCAK